MVKIPSLPILSLSRHNKILYENFVKRLIIKITITIIIVIIIITPILLTTSPLVVMILILITRVIKTFLNNPSFGH